MTLGDWIVDFRKANSVENDYNFIIKKKVPCMRNKSRRNIDIGMWCLIV